MTTNNSKTKKILNKAEQLKKIFNEDVKKVAIFIGNPDPDSIGAGLGMNLLIQRTCGAVCDLIYEGEVSHPQNKTLLNVLNIHFLNKSEVIGNDHPLLLEVYDKFVCVDHVPRERWCKELPMAAVIDHHKVNYSDSEFVDIRQVGSCCSIVLSYLLEAEIDFTQDDDGLISKAVTAMLFGVKTDTLDLMSENVAELDFAAYQHLVRYVSRSELEPIINYQLPAYYFDIRRVLEEEGNSITKGAFFVAGVGIITSARRDCLPMLADERVRMEGISTAIIFAVVDNCVEASVRSSNPAVDVNSFCKKVFGRDYAGGKLGAGAAKIPMGILAIDSLPIEMKEEAWETYRKIIMTKVFRVCESE
ncbi:bifunctional oligoribonuclease/PAP phosphatase NrnA [Candidatus Uabimicrobium sp. HlEnr_7]|uniref:DHH family phosphoesterase n=1 Tax=Candidatus Uabimicrobium helgolandensis TaxID=3095367 RepID=UPI0035564B95